MKKKEKPVIRKDSLKDLISHYSSSEVVDSLKEASLNGVYKDLALKDASLMEGINARFYSSKSIEKIERSINKGGLSYPLLAYEKDGKTYILDGNKRYLGALRSGIEVLPCILLNGREDDFYRFLLQKMKINHDCPLLYSSLFNYLEDKRGYREKELQELSSLSHGQVANLLRLKDATPYVQHLLIEGKLNLGKARLLVGMNETEARYYADQFIRMNVRDCEKMLQGDKGKRKNRPLNADYVIKDDRIIIRTRSRKEMNEILHLLKGDKQ